MPVVRQIYTPAVTCIRTKEGPLLCIQFLTRDVLPAHPVPRALVVDGAGWGAANTGLQHRVSERYLWSPDAGPGDDFLKYAAKQFLEDLRPF